MNQKKYKSLHQAGFTLVEALVAIAVMSVGLFAIMTFVSAQQKETRALNENLDKIDLLKLLNSTLADGTVCTLEVQENPLAFNPASIIPYPTAGMNQNPSFRIGQFRSSDDVTSPTVLVVGDSYGSNSTLKVESIVLNIIGAQPDPNKFTGEFVVSIDSSSMVRQLKPIRIMTTVLTDKNSFAPSKKIIGCLSPLVAAANSAPPVMSVCPILPSPPPPPVAVPVGGDCSSFSCPAANPYLAGCNLTALGSKGSFIVRYTKGTPSSTYLQEGTNCGKGGFTGSLYCSTVDSGPVSATSCPVHLGRGLSNTSYINQ